MPARLTHALLLPLALLLSGCPVWLSEGEETPPGPSRPDVCRVHGDCEGGFACLPERGECRPSGVCESHDECRGHERCDYRGTCVPKSEGECRFDDDCRSEERCVSGQCRPEAELCQFDYQCGIDGAGNALVCADNECVRVCARDAECGSGQSCEGGLCRPDASQCERSSDCPGALICTEGACLPICSRDADCPAAEVCAAGVCRPDTSPRPFCQGDGDCATGRSCVDGACRTPCPEAPATCQHFDFQFTVCNPDTLLCEAPNESMAECFGAADCPAAEICIDGLCR